MTLTVLASKQACGASLTGVDLRALQSADIKEIRAAWLEHHVVCFPEQSLTDDDLERFSLQFGVFGEDTFIAPIPDRKHVIALKRKAHEKSRLFAENWHTDWSFQEKPPAATCLYSITIPPVGGDTLFANQHKALDDMPDSLRVRLEGRIAIHSARGGYAPSGSYGEKDKAGDRSMDIRPSGAALKTQTHPVIRKHPETGREGLFGCLGYIIGFEDMETEDSLQLAEELHEWQTRPEFHYRHQWQENMLVMWDNRSVLHRATGGYEGYDRLLHRTTIAGPR